MDPVLESAVVAKARSKWAGPSNDLEIDYKPTTSGTDDGAWVAAWVWVYFDELNEEVAEHVSDQQEYQ